MNAGVWVEMGAGAFALGLTYLLGWWSVHRPNRVKRLSGAIRQPVLIGVIGWVSLLAGAMFATLSSSDSLDPGDNWPKRI